MRIRKSEKLLEFTSEYCRAPSPPTPWDSASAIVAAAGLLCEINRSSCTELSINQQSSNNQKEGLEIANEEMGVAGKSSDDKPSEQGISGDDRGSGITSKSSDDSRESTSRGKKSSGLDEQFDREAMADDLNGADEEGIGSANNLCNFNYKKKMKSLKKRGRKPMKARSLKSLLSFKVC